MKNTLLEIIDYFVKHKTESFKGSDVAVIMLKLIRDKQLT